LVTGNLLESVGQPFAVTFGGSTGHFPVESKARRSTATPQPAMTAHAAWLAVVNPVPMPAATMEPMTATPRDAPIWRLVEATAPATPACSMGIPDTAVLVIGAVTRPEPIPKMTYATTR